MKDALKNFVKKHLCRSLTFNEVVGRKPKTVRNSHWICSAKKSVFKKFTGKQLCWGLFLINLQFWGPAFLLKKTSAQVICFEITKSNYFEEHLSATAAKVYLKKILQHRCLPVDFVNYLRARICRVSTNRWFWNTSEEVSFWKICKSDDMKVFDSIRKKI